VNIVLRQDYTGVEGKVTYGTPSVVAVRIDGVDLSSGTQFNEEDEHLVSPGATTRGSDLFAGDRNLCNGTDQPSTRNNPSLYLTPYTIPWAQRTNIFSSTAKPCPSRAACAVKFTLYHVPCGLLGHHLGRGRLSDC